MRLPSAGAQQDANDRLSRVTALREAVARGQLRLAYQPVVAGDTLQLIGFEALARWRHPAWGEVPPSVFIPLAESTGLIESLGNWTMIEACRAQVQLAQQGLIAARGGQFKVTKTQKRGRDTANNRAGFAQRMTVVKHIAPNGFARRYQR